MADRNITSGRIHILPDSVSRKIAAGEVIDRPSALVRELIDNAVDAGSTEIDCTLRNGGLDAVRISDNGLGMTEEELKLCFLPHATSKIRTADDIYQVGTLGFRGEALASIAECTRMELTSRTADDSAAHRLSVEFGSITGLVPCQGKQGTTVSASALFHTMPGRKRFLKNRRSEGTVCKNAFLDKALPFPEIRFRLFNDDSLSMLLPRGTARERIAAAYKQFFKPEDLFEVCFQCDEYSFRLVAADPSVFRNDRRYVHIFLNRRRIDEYALVQAVEYGFSEFLPGGRYPFAFLFVEDNPGLVDFNIHPAKREVKLRNRSAIHHSVVEEIRKHLRSGTSQFSTAPALGESGGYSQPTDPPHRRTSTVSENVPETPFGFDFGPRPPADFRSPGEDLSPGTAAVPHPGRGFRYLGQIFGVFLLADKNSTLFLIDQHAAHERILYDRFSREPVSSQPLLFPRFFEISEDAAATLRNRTTDLEKLGIITEAAGDGGNEESLWKLSAVPAFCREREQVVVRFLKNDAGTSDDLRRDLLAAAACRAAVKDGEVLDTVTAAELIEQTFALEFPRCPHGRPLWHTVSRADLFHLVGRTL